MSQVRKSVFVLMFILLLSSYGNPLGAQTDLGSLRGQVTDPSGGAIANATVVAIGPSGAASTANIRGSWATRARLIFEREKRCPGRDRKPGRVGRQV